MSRFQIILITTFNTQMQKNKHDFYLWLSLWHQKNESPNIYLSIYAFIALFSIFQSRIGMGSFCSLQIPQSSTNHAAINITTDKIEEIEDDYDNPQRHLLSSKFLETNFKASNNLLQSCHPKLNSFRQPSAFIEDITAGLEFQLQIQDIVMSLSKIKKSCDQLPSVKVCYGDFVGVSKKKIEQKYRLLKKVGAGGYGQVFQAENQTSGEIRAIKVFKKNQIEKHRQEINILKECDHPNIIQIYEVIEYQSAWYVVMEFCDGGTIINLIKNNKYEYLQKEAKNILQQILQALVYLHAKGIVHRDIKLENVVFVKPTSDEFLTSNLKLIDFGNAEKVKFKVNRASVIGGTTLYMPPQAFSGWYSYTFDIWSCGVLLCILLTGYCPFKRKTKQQTISAIKNTEVDFLDQKWSKVSQEAKDLVKSMLNKDFMKRPSAQECLKSHWFQRSARFSQYRKASERFTKNLAKYYASNNFVSVVQSYLSFIKISQSQKNEIKRLFQTLDVKGQGQLRKQDLLKLCKQSVPIENEEKIKRIIEAIDKNKSGFIDYSQFQALMSDREKLFIRESLSTAFDYFDVDGSGYIEKHELISCLKDCQGEVDELITEIDKDRDEKISKEEFIQYFLKIEAVQNSPSISV